MTPEHAARLLTDFAHTAIPPHGLTDACLLGAAALLTQQRAQSTSPVVIHDDPDAYTECDACTCCYRAACVSKPPGCGWSDRFGYTCPCTGE